MRRSLTYFLLIFIIFIVNFIFIKAYAENQEIIIENNNLKNMKIESYEQCRKKGLHYVGKMTTPRIMHNTILLKDGNVLIAAGKSKTTSKNTTILGDYGPRYNYIDEKSAEIFNPKTNKFTRLTSKPNQEYYLKMLSLDNGNVLLVSKNFEIFDIKSKEFKIIGENRIIDKNGYSIYPAAFIEKIKDNKLLQCSGLMISNDNYYNKCWITNLDDFKIKEIQDIEIYVPPYLYPLYWGYFKLNNEEVLIYSKSYPRTYTKNLYTAVWNIKEKKITKIKEFFDTGNCLHSFQVFLDNNRVLFAGCGAYNHAAMSFSLCPLFMYNTTNNEIEQIPNLPYRNPKIKREELYKNEHLPFKIIKNSNDSWYFIENNKLKKIFSFKEKKFEPYAGFSITPISNPNIIQLNNHQLLITGGEIADHVKSKVFSFAFIYTF